MLTRCKKLQSLFAEDMAELDSSSVIVTCVYYALFSRAQAKQDIILYQR